MTVATSKATVGRTSSRVYSINEAIVLFVDSFELCLALRFSSYPIAIIVTLLITLLVVGITKSNVRVCFELK